MTRTVTDEDLAVLREALNEIKDSKPKGLFGLNFFSSQLVDEVVKNCARIFTIKDINDTCPVFFHEHAVIILEIFQEIFEDIPDFDEPI